MSRAPDALQRDRNRARRTKLYDEIDASDIDTEFERCCCNDRPQRAGLELCLGIEPCVARHAAVMRQNHAFTEPLPERVGGPLGQPARRNEHDRRAVRAHEIGDAIVDSSPLIVRGDGS